MPNEILCISKNNKFIRLRVRDMRYNNDSPFSIWTIDINPIDTNAMINVLEGLAGRKLYSVKNTCRYKE